MKAEKNSDRSGRISRQQVFSLLLICFFRLPLFAQDSTFAADLFNRFSLYSSAHLPEKCFVHIDKSDYTAGEIMWFKIYVVDGFYNKPSPLSKVVYAELLDAADNPVAQAKLAVRNADAGGSFDLPDTLKSGYYRFRAYTNWMKNSAPEYFFEKEILIAGAGAFIPTIPANAGGQVKSPDANNDSSGYAISLGNTNDGMIEAIVSTPSEISIGDSLTLFAQAHGLPRLVETQKMAGAMAKFRFPETVLGEGLNVFTAFGTSRKPLCEKLWFVPPRERLQIALQTNRTDFQPRDAVNLAISTNDGHGRALEADVSVSIYRMDSLIADETEISDYLWLTSELPQTHFSRQRSPDDKRMLVNAGNEQRFLSPHRARFSWDKIFDSSRSAPTYAPEIRDPVITGRIVAATSGKPAPLVYAYASVAGKNTLFRAAESGSDGIVRFEMPGLAGSSQLIVQTSREDSGYRVDLMSPFSDQYPVRYTAKEDEIRQPIPALATRLFNTQIQNAYQSDSMQQWTYPAQATTFFYGKPDYRYHLDDYTRFTNMEEVMREFVKACNVFRSEGLVKVVLYDLPAAKFFDGPPLVLLDGVPVFDEDRPMKIDPLQIRDIELVNRGYLLGPQKYAGIINLLSYHGDLAGYTLPAQAATVGYEGLQTARQFYSPDYSSDKMRASRVPDYRTQLCWLPFVSTGSEGKSAVRFYTSDIPGRYAIVVHGMNGGGIAGSQTIFFDVTARPKR